ncbi:hypothetical protein CBM2598_U30082 [Cupriavidus taiwanensis]|uniref:Uncharacterized protein n=1 Tax=Cupriavidus taiwanensis TaxID=164546 RepID=A0A7Z7JJ56_9BURK|nr:hypothetical protein CBM2598_U30082 [Cupriavidus taiwanensis]SPC25902.1 hypothetical protein CBM2594_U20089 [Cupriavidus taiwanensis]
MNRPLKSEPAVTTRRTIRRGWDIAMVSIERVGLAQGRALQRLPSGMNLIGVPQLFVGRRGVVGPDRLPRWAEALNVLAQNPRADVRIGASIEQMRARDAVSPQPRKMDGVDLHESDIFRTVGIAVGHPWPHAGLLPGDAAQQGRAHTVEGRSIVQAVGTDGAREHGQTDDCPDWDDPHSATFPGCSLNRTCGTRST